MAEIFISYKSERRAAAAHLTKILECHGYTVWYDYSLVKGRDFPAQIDAKVRGAKAVVVLWCSMSVQSEWVSDEASLAKDLGSLVPVMIEPCELRIDFRRKDYVNLTGWTGAPRDVALDPLLDALAQKIGRPPLIAYEALRAYETVWRNLGAPSFKAFALGTPLREREERRAPPLADAPTPAERDWKLIENSTDPRDFRAFIEEHKSGLLVRKAQHKLDDFAEAARAEAAELARREEAARLEAARQQEARYRAEGRIRVGAAFVRPPKLEWFLPGAGKAEGFKDAEFAPEMVVVPATKEFFWMGSKDDEGDPDERPRHKVKIPAPFAVGRYAVTFDEWDASVAAGGVKYTPPDQGWGRGRRPVINVSWDDAQAYIKWLSSRTGKAYRLLSEAEWEYCCRAGTETAYSFGDTLTKAQAQFSEGQWGSAGWTVEAGTFPANGFGLHDMHGNVWEWCGDCWNGDYKDKPDSLKANGGAWTTGDCSRRVLRGGSWLYFPAYCRSAIRSGGFAVDRNGGYGFRLARTLNY